MRSIKAIVYSNVWIALGASLYTLHTFHISQLEVDYNLLILVFFATLFSYNFQRIVRFDRIEGEKSERHLWLERNVISLRIITVISFVSATCLSFYIFTIKELLLLSIPFLLVIFYATFLSKTKKGLRDLPFVKIFIIALVWSAISGGLPFYLANDFQYMGFILIEKFLFILAITIPFDIRDLIYDKAKQKTLPMVFGENGSKVVAAFCLIVSFWISFNFGATLELIIPFYILTLFLVLCSNKNRQELYFAGLIDGLLVISPLVFI